MGLDLTEEREKKEETREKDREEEKDRKHRGTEMKNWPYQK